MEKAYAVAAGSTIGSQNVNDATCSDHFWNLRYEKSARCFGAKQSTSFLATFGSLPGHVVAARSTFQSENVQRTAFLDILGPFWKLESRKRGHAPQSTFDVKNEKKLRGAELLWTFRCRFLWQVQGVVHLAKDRTDVRVLQQFPNDSRKEIQ